MQSSPCSICLNYLGNNKDILALLAQLLADIMEVWGLADIMDVWGLVDIMDVWGLVDIMDVWGLVDIMDVWGLVDIMEVSATSLYEKAHTLY